MSENKIIIRLETRDDYRNVENLTREAFWNVYRPGCMEHYVLHCYRNDPAFVPELDFVMELDGELIGQVIYVRSEIDCDDGRKVPIMTFARSVSRPHTKDRATASSCSTIPWKKPEKWAWVRWQSPAILIFTASPALFPLRLRVCIMPPTQRRTISDPRVDARLSGRHLRHLQRSGWLLCMREGSRSL